MNNDTIKNIHMETNKPFKKQRMRSCVKDPWGACVN